VSKNHEGEKDETIQSNRGGGKEEWPCLLAVVNGVVEVAVDAGRAIRVLCRLADLLRRDRCAARGEELVTLLV
jgi:hypothetical protein